MPGDSVSSGGHGQGDIITLIEESAAASALSPSCDNGAAPRLAATRAFLQSDAQLRGRSVISRLFGVSPVRRAALASYSAAVAELAVTETLAALPAGWTVLNDVSTGAEPPVEHLLIGPPGIFAITLRVHSGERVWAGETSVVVGLRTYGYLAEAEQQAAGIAGRLGGRVTPCILVIDAAELDAANSPRAVEVLDARQLGAWLADLPRLLSPLAVQRLAAAALAPGTWTGDGAAAEAVDLERFASIGRDIRTARHRRLAWAIVGAVLTQGAVLALLPLLADAALS